MWTRGLGREDSAGGEQLGWSRAGRLSRDVGNRGPLSGGSFPVILHPRPSREPPVSFKGCVALTATVVFTSTYFAEVEAPRVHLRVSLLRWSNELIFIKS